MSSTTPDPALIARAAGLLRAGRLVAFPTETVYGLGASALDPAAVARIFAAKGRPATNPVIVHAPDVAAARELVTDWSGAAQALAERFWPGPLSLVLPKASAVPDLVTAGGPTVAVRVPAHPVALELLRACGIPVAAPSANRSNAISPTRAEHVAGSLGDAVDLILDAGPTPGGIESTVLDLTARPPRLLRPGLVTPAEIESVIGHVDRTPAASAGALRSPGMFDRHYAPQTPLELVVGDARPRVDELAVAGGSVGWLRFGDSSSPSPKGVTTIDLPPNPAGYARELYAALHVLDALGLDRIVVELPPRTEEWLAVHDRLRRAAAS